MTYDEAEKFMFENLNIVDTDGNDKFPYRIDRLLIMPIDVTIEEQAEIVKWVVFNGLPFKKGLDVSGLGHKSDFDVYVFSKEINQIFPLLRDYLL